MVPDKVEKLCQRAQLAIAERDWDKAKQAYLMALGLRSDLPDVHYGLATVYFQLRELTSAAHHFREVTRIDPLRAGAFVNLGAVLNLLDQYDEAITALRRGIQLDGQRVEGYYNLGLVYRRKGQIDLAIQAYREAVRVNPRMADAHLNLANLLLDKQQPRLALQHYQEALKLRPGWEKALDGQDQAQAALSGEGRDRAAAGAVTTPTVAVKAGADLDRMVDPLVHQNYLTSLHQASIQVEDTARLVQKILGEEIEPAIKELSSALLHVHGPRSELDSSVQKFETALQRLKAAQTVLKNSVARGREIGEHPPE
jgi:tetratricopeptide (TPR) repeat protein